MPRTSQEAIDRRNKKRRDDRGSAKATGPAALPKSDLPAYKIAARRMLPRLPEGTTKADLRAMLAAAAANTARM